MNVPVTRISLATITENIQEDENVEMISLIAAIGENGEQNTNSIAQQGFNDKDAEPGTDLHRLGIEMNDKDVARSNVGEKEDVVQGENMVIIPNR